MMLTAHEWHYDIYCRARAEGLGKSADGRSGETIATQIAMKTDAHQAVLQAQRQMAWIQTPGSMSY